MESTRNSRTLWNESLQGYTTSQFVRTHYGSSWRQSDQQKSILKQFLVGWQIFICPLRINTCLILPFPNKFLHEICQPVDLKPKFTNLPRTWWGRGVSLIHIARYLSIVLRKIAQTRFTQQVQKTHFRVMVRLPRVGDSGFPANTIPLGSRFPLNADFR